MKKIFKEYIIDNRSLREKLLIRLLVAPIYILKRKKEHREYINSADSEEIKKFKNLHQGERCFILGNGPSLNSEDLDKLKNETTFASNQIYKIFDRTDWRPTYYVSIDKSFLKGEFETNGDIPVDCRKKFIDVYGKNNKKLTNSIFIFAHPNYTVNVFNEKPKYSEDISDHISMGQTVAYTMIQIATYMGFKEIYLLGVDFSMPYIKDKHGKIHKTDEEKTHFDGVNISYPHYIIAVNYQSQLNAYLDAKEYCERNKIKIVNSTRGGKLEVFKRIPLEMVLEG